MSIVLFLVRTVKNSFLNYIYKMSLRQAYEKNFQATSCFISQYSQVEWGKKNQTRQHFAILTEIIIRYLLVPQHTARQSLPLVFRV